MKNSKNHIKLPLVGTYDSVEIPYGDYNEILHYLILLVLSCPRGTIDRSPKFGIDNELHSLTFTHDRPTEVVEDILSKLLEDLNFWLAEYINVESIDLRFEDDRAFLCVKYIILRDNSKKVLRVSRTII